MMYKTLSLIVMFVLFLGVNRSNAQDAQDLPDPCDCICEIGLAVDAVVAAEADGWVTPFALTNLVVKLEYLSGGGVYGGLGFTSIEVIVDKMILVTQRAIVGTCNTGVPPPTAVVEALESLLAILLRCE